MNTEGLPETPRRALIAVLLALLAILVVTGAVRAAQSVPAGTPIPACAANGPGLQVQPCHWSESDDNITTNR